MSTAEVSNVIAGLDFIRDVNVYGVEVPGRILIKISSYSLFNSA